jgi:glycosyltransferase involved in cell wall biosynthesis
MAGTYPVEYNQDPIIDKPLDEFYRHLETYTMELLPGEPCNWIYSFVLLPPLRHDGVVTRGILLTMAAEFLIDRYPAIQELFHIVASGQWCSFAWSRRADSLCSIYANPRRDAWFRTQYPERACGLLPIQEADWTNDRSFSPGVLPPSRDVLCVSRQLGVKNLPFLARALKTYRQKYGPIRMTLVGGFNTDWSALEGEPLRVMRRVASVLGGISEYLDLEDFRPPEQMPDLYRDHKIMVMGSLLEGKNRAIHEAMACGVPIVCCREFNQHIRGSVEAFPPGAGVYATFDPEAYADAMHLALREHGSFAARAAYQGGFSGRAFVLERCLRELPEFAKTLPDFSAAQPLPNEWLEAALARCYACTTERFLFEENLCNAAIGLDHHDMLFDFYRLKMAA